MSKIRCWVAAGFAVGLVLGACGPKPGPEPRRAAGRRPPPGQTVEPPRRDPPARGGVSNEAILAAIKKNPSKAEYHFTLALRLDKAGRKKEAVNYYRNAAAIKHDYFEPRFNLGMVYMGWKQYGEAAKWFGRAVEVDPKHFNACYNHASTLLRSRQYPAAEKALAHLLKLKDPKRKQFLGRIHYLRAVTALRLGRTRQALKSYQAAVKAGNDTAEVYARIGYLLMADKRKQKQAMKYYRMALRKDPAHGLALANVGGMLMRQGKVKQAVPYLEKAARAIKNGVGVRVNLGLAYLRLKKYKQALLPLEQAYKLKPELQLGQLAYGVALMFHKKVKRGTKLVVRAVKANKKLAGLLGGYVLPLANQKNLDGAIELLKAILIAQPDNRVAKKNLLILLRRRGD